MNAFKYLTSQKLILTSAVVGAFSLVLIALRLAPIADYSRSLNRCVNTTIAALSTVPRFQAEGISGMEAMSVSLCNGSIPQKVE